MSYHLEFHDDTIKIEPPLTWREIQAADAAVRTFNTDQCTAYFTLFRTVEEELTDRGVLRVITCGGIIPTHDALEGNLNDGEVIAEMNTILAAVDPGHRFTGAIEVSGGDRWDIRRVFVVRGGAPATAVGEVAPVTAAWEVAAVTWSDGTPATTRHRPGLYTNDL